MTPINPAKRKVTPDEANEIRRARILDTNKLDPKVTLVMDGNDLILEFTNRAVKDVEKELGINLFNGEFTAQHMTNPTMLSRMLYFGLRKHQPELTLEQIDDMFSFRHFGYYMNRLTEALSMFTPDTSDIQEPEQPVNGIERPM